MKVAAGCRRLDRVTTIFLLLLVFSHFSAAQPTGIDVVWNRCDVTSGGLTSGTDRVGFTICTTDASHTTVGDVNPQTISVTVGPVGHQVTQSFTIPAGAGCITRFYPDDFGAIPTFYVGTYYVSATSSTGTVKWQVGGSTASGGCSGFFNSNAGSTPSVTNPIVTLALSAGPYQIGQPITASANANANVPEGLASLSISTPDGTWFATMATGCPTGPMASSISPPGAFTPLVAGTYTFSAQATNCVGGSASQWITITVAGCNPTVSVNPNPPVTNSDFTITTDLAGCPAGNYNVEYIIVDPLGATHKATALGTGGGGTGAISYLRAFDNSPTTEMCGYYKLTVKNPLAEDQLRSIIVTVPTSECKIVPSKGSNTAGLDMAMLLANCGGVQDPFSRDIVTCCNLDCCGSVSFDKECNPSASYGIPGNDLAVRTGVLQQDKPRPERQELCSAPDPNSPGAYIVVDLNTTRYQIVGKSLDPDNSGKTYYIVDTMDGPGRSGCIVGASDIEGCGQRHNNFVMDKRIYRDHIETYVVPYIPDPDMRLSFGFYITWMPPYEYVLDYSRYVYVYGRNYTDNFYCYIDEPNTAAGTPDTIRKSYWCHNTNLGWYSVLGTNRGNKINMAITNESIQHVRRWNNLTGYVVLGHASPWCMACYYVQVW